MSVPGNGVDASVAEQVAVAPVPARVQIPVAEGLKVAVPVGVITVPAVDESVTLAVHSVVCPMSIVAGEHVTLTVVVRLLTPTLEGVALLLLPECVLSPL